MRVICRISWKEQKGYLKRYQIMGKIRIIMNNEEEDECFSCQRYITVVGERIKEMFRLKVYLSCVVSFNILNIS
jgi:hypothetical protein